MNFRIIPMTESHLPNLAALEARCFPADPWSEHMFRQALDSPDTVILLAEGEDSTLLGYAVLYTVLDEGNLDNIAVARSFRRRGVADALLSALAGLCRERGIVRLMLEVRASNAPALALYHKYGFAEVGWRKNYYRNPREDAILMTWEIRHENS